jgi:peptidoglycan hydrolase-like protein with peptidoglycan-binding domain
MLRWLGIPLLLMGIGVGFVSFRSQGDSAQSLEEVLKRQETRARAWLVERPSGEAAASSYAEQADNGQRPSSTAKWRQEVVVRRASEVPLPSEPIVSSPRDALASTTPEDPSARYELARSLQSELRRVGCYDGEIDGSWGPASKRAIQAFMDRVNAALPGEEPDFILLRLVQNEKAKVCGVGCPSGQTLQGQRCVALGATVKRPARATARLPDPQAEPAAPAASAQPAEPVPALEGRMSVGAPPAPVSAPPASERKPVQTDRARQDRPPAFGFGVANAYAPPPRPEGSKRWTRTIWDTIASRR